MTMSNVMVVMKSEDGKDVKQFHVLFLSQIDEVVEWITVDQLVARQTPCNTIKKTGTVMFVSKPEDAVEWNSETSLEYKVTIALGGLATVANYWNVGALTGGSILGFRKNKTDYHAVVKQKNEQMDDFIEVGTYIGPTSRTLATAEIHANNKLPADDMMSKKMAQRQITVMLAK